MNRKESFSPGEYYHIYNRGNNKQNIFLDNSDYERFIKLLYLCNSSNSVNFRLDIVRAKIDAFDYDKGKSIVSIGAWVLMLNHFHLLLTIPVDEHKSSNLPKLNFGKLDEYDR